MKQGKNNEIDLLLRSLASDAGAQSPLTSGHVPAQETQVFSDHLDADELSSFAEGVVPAAARARFMVHLADCDSCRGVMVRLAQASGATAGVEPIERETGAGFWRKMASLFAPQVLRYAVPAVALTAVIAVSFFALRQKNLPDLVAQRQATNSATPALSTAQPAESPLAESSIEDAEKTRSSTDQKLRLDTTTERKGAQENGANVAKTAATTADSDTPSASLRKSSDQSKPADRAGVDSRVFAPEPASLPAPPPPPKSAVNEADKVGEVPKEELSRRQVQGLPVEDAKNQPRDEAGRHGPSRSNNAVNGARRADNISTDGLMSERAESRAKSKKDSDDEGEMRTVSGKRFRRQGSVWIDTAYESSRRTINVARGSEQFRALVADEPTIGRIAEKLSGIVIVVSNGRSYRIH